MNKILSKIFDSRLEGTLILAAKGSDGIIIASDSRLSIRGNTTDASYEVGFVDNFQKIFVVGKYAFAVSGAAYCRNESVRQILNNFLTINSPYTHPASFLKLFIDYTINNYPEFHNLMRSGNSKMICCGYYNNQQCVSMAIDDKISFHAQYLITSETNGDFRNRYNVDLPCSKLKELAIETINSFSVLNQQEQYHIGGDTEVLQILPDSSFEWLTESGNLIYWNTFREYIDDFLNDRHDFKIINKEYFEPLREMYRRIIDGELPL